MSTFTTGSMSQRYMSAKPFPALLLAAVLGAAYVGYTLLFLLEDRPLASFELFRPVEELVAFQNEVLGS